MAAAGIGAGDVVVASVTGLRFGSTLLWAIALTAVLKFILTEALARWQLATGETIVRAGVTRLPRAVGVTLAAYLVLWAYLVGASLSSTCGLAGASLWPVLSVQQWGVVHAVVAALLVALNRFSAFQRVMKGLIAVMAGCVGACAVLALLGGIGGSVTVCAMDTGCARRDGAGRVGVGNAHCPGNRGPARNGGGAVWAMGFPAGLLVHGVHRDARRLAGGAAHLCGTG